ncbi:MAG: molybdate ABC transporter permease subunit [Candidatus Omnitrophica bacterium]|nr:molybdate ABC transporter permease subunit [Candidatus Omnitrophota bacterium]MDE2214971.1 molybdate ABC transporter permease subunit [Candidatus Omnitrophota bacterium]MDE2230910.1 molybdate ABC transporter permease subunit [Candidatus Omnitrophota bacterium]
MHYDLQPLLLTFQLALVVTAILFVIGIPLAYWIAFSPNRFRYIVETLVSMPLVLPPTVVGFYLLVAFSPQYFLGHFLQSAFGLRVVFSFTGLVIASLLFSLPFMVNPIKAGFQNFPSALIESSYCLGKGPWETLYRVILPNIRPALLTGVVMAFAHTIGEFGVVLMIGGNIPGQTRLASIAIYNEVEALNYGTAGMYALVLVMISFVVLFLFYYLNRRTLKIF